MTAQEPRILTIGDIMAEVTVRLSGDIARGSDTPVRIRTGWGGSAANVAAWLAATNLAAAFLGRVGADAFGQASVDALRAAGVRLFVGADADRATGTCVVLVHPDGERSMLPDAGANGGLRPAHLSAGAFAWATHLHLSAYPLFNAESRAAGLTALAKARESGISASIDAASAAPLATAGADNFLTWTKGVDLLFANAAEASVLVEEADPRAAAERLLEQYPAVVVKLGARGAVWASRDATPIHVDGPLVKVADTTGAGDAFAAGFLGAGLRGAEPRAALTAATTLAARAVSQLGARPHP